MKTELKVYVSEKWRFYLSVCVCVCIVMCVCVRSVIIIIQMRFARTAIYSPTHVPPLPHTDVEKAEKGERKGKKERRERHVYKLENVWHFA